MMRTISWSSATTRVAATIITLVPCDSAELVLLGPGGEGSRVLDDYNPGSLLGCPSATLLLLRATTASAAASVVDTVVRRRRRC